MLDFNTKKELLRKLRMKRSKNKALWLPCLIAELCVKAWYAVICRAGLALSDKNGRFLGVGSVGDKPKTRRQDDIVYVRKSFWGRMLSAALAASLVMMFIPEMSILTYALSFKGEEYEVYAVTGVQTEKPRYYKKADKDAAAAAYVSIDECKIGYGALQVRWVGSEDADGYYIEVYQQGTKSPVKTQQALGGSDYAIVSGLSHDVNTTYEVSVKPYYKIQIYEYTAPQPPDPDTPGSEGVEEDMAALLGSTFEQVGTEDASSKMNVGSLNSSMANPKLEPIKYDNNITATLTWDHVNQISGPEANQSYTYSEGYIVYRRTVNAESSAATAWTQIAQITDIKQGVNLFDGKISCSDTVLQGVVYEYYVKAYRAVFGPNGYHEDNPGMITSGDEKSTTPTRLTTTPTRPKNLKITSNKKDTLTLNWTAGSGSCSGYAVYRSDKNLSEESMKALTPNINDNKYYNAATGEWNYSRYIRDEAAELELVSSSVKTYADKDTALINSKTYYYYVMAYLITDSGGTAIYGLPAFASGSISSSLTAPQGFTATPGDGKVSLKWDTVPGADGYKIYITKNANYNGSSEGVGKTTSVYVTKNSYEHVGLYNGDQYSYQIRAYINSTSFSDPTVEDYDKVLSDYSDTRKVTVGISLEIPQDLKLSTKDGEVTVSWSAVAGAKGYVLYYRKSNESVWKTIDLSKPGFTHTGLNNNDTYSYKVVAYKEVSGVRVPDVPAQQPPADKESVTLSIVVGVPLDAPKDFTGTTSDGRVDLKWSAVNGAQGYILHIIGSSGTHQKIDLSKPGFTHTGLANGETYTYYVQSYKVVNGVRVYSSEDVTSANRVTLTVGDSLESPKDFTAVTTDGQVDLSWTKVAGATGYVLYAYGNGRSYQFDLSKTVYKHTGLDNGDNWTYYVSAYKTVNGSRVYSNPTKSTTVTVGVSLNAAMDLTATAGNRQIDLTWTAVKGAEGYVVYLYNSDTEEFEPITVVSKTNYSHVGLKNGRKYTYMVAPFKTVNGERRYGDYSMSVDAIPTTGSVTDMDHSLNVKGTTPYGISHSEYISAAANHGAFDESVDVYFSTNNESTDAVKDVLKNYADGLSSFIIYPFDISVYEEDTLIDVEPYDGYNVTVTMPIPDRLIAYRDYITVVHIGEKTETEVGTEELGTNSNNASDWLPTSSGSLEVLPCAVVDIDNIWCVQFVCSSFSPYALVIYKEHILDVSAGGGIIDGSFAGTFNSGVLLFTALPDIMPNNKRLKVVSVGKKRYRIKSIEKK